MHPGIEMTGVARQINQFEYSDGEVFVPSDMTDVQRQVSKTKSDIRTIVDYSDVESEEVSDVQDEVEAVLDDINEGEFDSETEFNQTKEECVSLIMDLSNLV